MISLALTLALGIQQTEFLHSVRPGRQVILATDRACLVSISGDPRPIERNSRVPGNDRIALEELEFISGSGPLLGRISVVDYPGRLRGLSGKYVAFLQGSSADGRLLGAVRALPTDYLCLFAVKLPDASKYSILESDSATASLYRALFEQWDQLDPVRLADTMRKMPALDGGPGGATFYDSPSREVGLILDASARLTSVQRIVVLRQLLADRFRCVEGMLEDAIWEGRNDPWIDKIDLDFKLTGEGLRGPKNYFVDGSAFLKKAESCNVDSVRAFYVRSIVSGAGVDRRRLAALLASCGPKSQFEVVAQLGHFSQDPDYYVERIDPERLPIEIPRLVSYWRKHYGV